MEISGADLEIDEGVLRGYVHFAGASMTGGRLVSSGGRVLAATGIAPSLSEALDVAYQIMDSISLEGSYFRADIGYRELSRRE